MHSKTTLAYAAGIFDGEGYFSIIWHKPRDRYFGFVGVLHTNLDLLNWLQSTFGGPIYHRRGPSQKSHWKPRYDWRATNFALDAMLVQITPFLMIKKRHAEIMIEFRRTMLSTRRTIDPIILAERKRLRERLLVLNDRGRALT